MADFPAVDYISNAGRTEGEQKDALEDWLAATKQLPGAGGAVSTLTIASGSVTPTTGEHLVDTEGAAGTDDLANLLQTNLPDGSLLLLRSASVARVVVVKHAAGGTGQVAIADGADLSLVDPSQWLLLRRNSTQWDEVGRHYGNQKAALRTRYDLPSLTAGANTFTKTQEWAKGADLASAATLALGADGNYFGVTGTTTITALSAKTVGTRVLLQFAAALTLTHHATNLILQNAINLATTAGDVLELVSIGSSQWREINRHLVSASAGLDPEASVLLMEDFFGTAAPQPFAIVGAPTYTGTWPGTASVIGTYDGGNNPLTAGAIWASGVGLTAAILPTVALRWASLTGGGGSAMIRYCGLTSVAPNGQPSDGIYFRHTATGNIIAVCRASNSESTLDTTVAAANGVFHTGRLAVVAAGQVDVYLDGVLIGSITSNIPSATLFPGVGCANSVSGPTGFGVTVDFLSVGADR